MKKYRCLLSIIFVMSVFGFAQAAPAFTPAQSSFYVSSSKTAQLFSYIIKDEKAALRYVTHAQLYAKKSRRSWNDTALDYVAYPMVDKVVGYGMESITIETDQLSDRQKKIKEFVVDNTQLIVSASVIKLVSIESDKGIMKADRNDGKLFVRSCAVQVGCDVLNKTLVEPLVGIIVEDTTSWTATVLRFVGSRLVGRIVIGQVNKI